MKFNKSPLAILLLIIGGCDSESDDVSITNNYITETPTVISLEEQAHIGEFTLLTAVETDFFVIEKEMDLREFYYSNSNTFHFDKGGYLVNGSGSPLMVYPVNPDGSAASVSVSTSQSVQINYSMGSPEATDRVNVSINLPEASSELAANEFDNNDPITFNNSTSVSVIDSLGDFHLLTFYFIHVSTDNNTWELRVALDDITVQPTAKHVLDFDSSGLIDINDDDLDGFITTSNGLIENINIPLNNGANDLSVTLDFTSDTTSFNSNFEVTSLDASGFYTGHVKELKIDSSGLITLFYTNGQYELIGKVALAKFLSPYNLQPLDNSLWEETEDSGTPIYGEPEFSNFGSIVPVVHDF
jgi:flagellar hook protein FlgE